ncbi:hypothetical protein H8E88_03610 [candidate division KSB1 bacterium]|nr:hypothetical protein [candidate division KSB1 bacterium]MBL7094589.1 hypothetical protein [candidate division KSB1 bacterium]
MSTENVNAIQYQNGLEEIRDIIVGNEIKEWRDRVNDLKQECNKLKKRLSTFEKNFDDSNNLIKEKVQKLKVSQTNQQETQLLIENIKKELDRQLNEIRENKVDKDQIGQAFIDWGAKIKQETANKAE